MCTEQRSRATEIRQPTLMPPAPQYTRTLSGMSMALASTETPAHTGCSSSPENGQQHWSSQHVGYSPFFVCLSKQTKICSRSSPVRAWMTAPPPITRVLVMKRLFMKNRYRNTCYSEHWTSTGSHSFVINVRIVTEGHELPTGNTHKELGM